MGKLSVRTKLYLSTIDEWKAPYEVATLLGDNPPPSINAMKSVLGRLISRGLVQYSSTNGVYRITPSGRLALKDTSHEQQ